MSEHVQVVDEGAVRTITLDRPAARNALDHGMYEALTAALVSADHDDGLRAVVLRGAGPTFCAGNDLVDFLERPPEGPDSPVMRFLATVSRMETPLIASVRGAAVGIGTTVLLHCDLAYCAPDTTFLLPFAKLGAVPEAGSSRLIPLRVGHRRAFELLVLGVPASAEEGVRDGFVNAVVDDPDAAAAKAAKAVAALPAGAVRESKRLLREGPERPLSAVIGTEADAFVKRTQTPEFKAAIQAFFDARRG